jgi:hypothetical protein
MHNFETLPSPTGPSKDLSECCKIREVGVDFAKYDSFDEILPLPRNGREGGQLGVRRSSAKILAYEANDQRDEFERQPRRCRRDELICGGSHFRWWWSFAEN